MVDIITKIFICLFVVGGIVWGIWYEHSPEKKDDKDNDCKSNNSKKN